MRFFNKISSTFLKYLISYILILLIPLILSVFINTKFLSILKNQAITDIINTSRKIENFFDIQYKQIQSTNYQMGLNPNFRPFVLSQNPYKAVLLRNDLLKYKAVNNFIEDIIVYFEDENYIHTTTSSYTFKQFFNEFNFINWDESSFYRYLNTNYNSQERYIEDVLLKNGDQERYVAYVFPIMNQNSNSHGKSIFLVRESQFTNYIGNELDAYHCNTIIYDKDNKMIFLNEEKDYINSKDFLSFLNIQEEHFLKIIKLEETEYILNITNSQETRWKYVTLLPAAEISNKVKEVNVYINISLLFVFIIGGYVIYVLMRVNYKPIKQLEMSAKRFLTSTSKNELETVSKAIENLSSKNTELTGKIKSNEAAAKYYLFHNLLKGKFLNEEDFIEKSKNSNISFIKQYFGVVIVYINQFAKIKEFNKAKFIKKIEIEVSNIIDVNIIEHFEPEKIILIVSSDTEDSEMVNEFYKKLYDYFSKNEIKITIGVGNLYTDILKLQRSYREASTALDYRFVNGNDKVILFKEIIDAQSSIDVILYKEVEKLKLSIAQMESRQIDNLMNSIIRKIKENNISLYMARGICFDIINSIAITIEELNKSREVECKYHPNTDVFGLMKSETVEELFYLLKGICNEVIESINKAKYKHDNILSENILAYIMDNYSNCSFSIDDTASHFNMSQPNLSLFFKEHMGINFIDYVTELRMNKAKKILISSDLVLKDIASEVGYFNVSSFIRRFKQVIGITPSKFRETHKV